MFCVAAETAVEARAAAALAEIDYEDLPAILTIEDALAAKSFVLDDQRLRKGDAAAAIAAAALALVPILGPIAAVAAAVTGIGAAFVAVSGTINGFKAANQAAMDEAEKGAKAMTDRWVAMGNAYNKMMGITVTDTEKALDEELAFVLKQAEERQAIAF